jgi:hypothetical protein
VFKYATRHLGFVGTNPVMFELTSETGARLGEDLGVVWVNVDLDGQAVCFTHQLDRNGKQVALKTERSCRCVEVTPGLVAKLRAAKIAASASREHDFVFVSRAARRTITATSPAV